MKIETIFLIIMLIAVLATVTFLGWEAYDYGMLNEIIPG